MGEEGLKTPSAQKNPYEDDSVVSPALDKDAIIVHDEGKKAVDQPAREPAHIPTIIILGSTQVNVLPLVPVQEKVQEA